MKDKNTNMMVNMDAWRQMFWAEYVQSQWPRWTFDGNSN